MDASRFLGRSAMTARRTKPKRAAQNLSYKTDGGCFKARSWTATWRPACGRAPGLPASCIRPRCGGFPARTATSMPPSLPFHQTCIRATRETSSLKSGSLTLVVRGSPTTPARRVMNLSLRAGSKLRYLSPACLKLFSCTHQTHAHNSTFMPQSYPKASDSVKSLQCTMGKGPPTLSIMRLSRAPLMCRRFSGKRSACLTGSNRDGK